MKYLPFLYSALLSTYFMGAHPSPLSSGYKYPRTERGILSHKALIKHQEVFQKTVRSLIETAAINVNVQSEDGTAFPVTERRSALDFAQLAVALCLPICLSALAAESSWESTASLVFSAEHAAILFSRVLSSLSTVPLADLMIDALGLHDTARYMVHRVLYGAEYKNNENICETVAWERARLFYSLHTIQSYLQTHSNLSQEARKAWCKSLMKVKKEITSCAPHLVQHSDPWIPNSFATYQVSFDRVFKHVEALKSINCSLANFIAFVGIQPTRDAQSIHRDFRLLYDVTRHETIRVHIP